MDAEENGDAGAKGNGKDPEEEHVQHGACVVLCAGGRGGPQCAQREVRGVRGNVVQQTGGM